MPCGFFESSAIFAVHQRSIPAQQQLPAVLPRCTHELLPYRLPRLSHPILLFRPSCFNSPSLCTPGCSDTDACVGARSFPSRWLVYNQKVKSSDIFIRDSSCVSDYALLLFGGALSTQASLMPLGYRSSSVAPLRVLQGLNPSCLRYLSTRN